ncbi:hypothetical protein IWQ61_003751 [Dispira simplex]|nr:hypothetical protein IWQ61_003751 [Dispira simplex]
MSNVPPRPPPEPRPQQPSLISESPGCALREEWQDLVSQNLPRVFLPTLDALDQQLQTLVRRQVELHHRLSEASQQNGWGAQPETIPHVEVLEKVCEYKAKLHQLRKRMITLEGKSGQLTYRTKRLHALQSQAKQSRQQFMTQQSQLDQTIEARRVSPTQTTGTLEPITSVSHVVGKHPLSLKPTTSPCANDGDLGHVSEAKSATSDDNNGTMAARLPLPQTDTETIAHSPTPSNVVRRTQATQKKRQPRKVTID